jgi:hypothetical protein
MSYRMTRPTAILFAGLLFSLSAIAMDSSADPARMPESSVPTNAQTAPNSSSQTEQTIPVQPPVVSTPSSPNSPAEAMICRSRTEFGSRVKKRRECRTAADWERVHKQANDILDSAGRRAAQGGTKSGS